MGNNGQVRAGTHHMKGSGYRLMAEGAVIGLITGALISMFRSGENNPLSYTSEW